MRTFAVAVSRVKGGTRAAMSFSCNESITSKSSTLAGIAPADIKAPICPFLRFDMNLPREFRQRLTTGLGHEDGFADFDAPALHPHPQDGMNDIAGHEHSLVARPQADRMLTPVGRI